MKKLIFILIIFTSLSNVSAQIEINSSGQVGVGTTNPQYRLDVAGDARVTGNIFLGSTFNSLGTTSNIALTFKVNNVLAGFTGRSGNANVSFGYGALNPLTGSANTAIGYNTLFSNTTGNSNTATGYVALYSNTTGGSNTAIGRSALYSNTTGSYNIATGYAALYSNTEGNYNSAIGFRALYSNTTGDRNAANGDQALYSNTTGSYNIATGYAALYSNTTGDRNTATGVHALSSNTTGIYNTANGFYALRSNTEGNYNTAIGFYALSSNTTGSANTATGYYAFRSNTTGEYNTANGVRALFSNTEGNYNTAIGYLADVNAGDLTNATAVGYNAKATASNQVRIGNSSVTSIGGYAAWSNLSDGRTKKNIRANVPGLAFIKLLQPVTYNLDLDAVDELLKSGDIRIDDPGDSLRVEPSPAEKAIEAKARANKEQQVNSGFIAQDVEKTAKSIGYDFSGVDVDENGVYGLRYSEFVVPLVKAVQELSEQNDAKDITIALLQKQVNELTGLVHRLAGKE